MKDGTLIPFHNKWQTTKMITHTLMKTSSTEDLIKKETTLSSVLKRALVADCK